MDTHSFVDPVSDADMEIILLARLFECVKNTFNTVG